MSGDILGDISNHVRGYFCLVRLLVIDTLIVTIDNHWQYFVRI